MHYLRTRPLRDIAVAIVFLGLIAVLIVSSVWAYHEYMTSPPYVDRDRYPVRGIDISRHNGEIEFDKVAKAGLEFVFIKASEGLTYKDPLFAANLEKAQKAGLKAGAYHFFRFDCEGVPQAMNFLEAVDSRKLDLGLVIDIEKAGNPEDVEPELIQDRLASMVEFMNLLGLRVMFYTNVNGYYDYLAENYPGCPLWICGFNETPINTEWIFWQYDHHGKVEGMKGEFDLDAFYGNRKEWEKYLEESACEVQLKNNFTEDGDTIIQDSIR